MRFHSTMVYLALQEIFGSTEIFHGRTREIEILKGIYRDVCQRPSSSGNRTHKTDPLSLQQTSNHSSNHENPENPAVTIADDGTETIESFEPDTRYYSQSHLSPSDRSQSHYSQSQRSHTQFSQSHQSHSRETIGESIRSEREKRKMVAFISGISGSGKSALVKQFVEDLRKESQNQNDDETTTSSTPGAPLFLTGKFNELAGSDPYSAFVEAFSEINTLLLGNDERPPNKEYQNDLFRIQRNVKKNLAREDV